MNMPEYSTLLLTVESHVATVTLNRPDKANAMNDAMWSELETCFNWCDSEPSVRVVILAAKGKHFCAGLDLSAFANIADAHTQDRARQAEMLRRKILTMQRNLTAIEQCRKPVLAAIHSSCIGGGVDMVSCCDMRYCTTQAHFSIKEIDIGMTADVGTLQRMPYLVGDGIMRELAYTGRKLEAAEAKELGLVNSVYSDQEQLMQAVSAIATTIAQKSPLAIRGTKEMLLYTRDHSVNDALNYIATWNAGMLSAEDLMKGMSAGASGDLPEFDD